MATSWGIASCGMISHDFVNAMTTLPTSDHKVVAVAARSLKSAEEFNKKFGFETAKAYEGYKSLADDSEVEVVYVGAINPAHLELATMMLNAGKHVLCEKPLGINVKQTKEIIECARKNKKFLMEAVWSRTLPSYKKISQVIKDGTIGEVKNVVATFGFPLARVERLMKKDMGGGTILDLGIYTVQIAQLAMAAEKPSKIAATGHMNEEGVDLGISASMVYSEGRSATIVTSAEAKLPCDAVIVGTKGMIRVPEPFWCTSEIEVVMNISRVQRELKVEKFNWELPQGAKLDYNFPNSNNLAHEAQHVRECILAGKLESPLLSLDESLVIAEIMEDIRKQVGVVYNED